MKSTSLESIQLRTGLPRKRFDVYTTSSPSFSLRGSRASKTRMRQPRPQGFSLKKWVGRENRALAFRLLYFP